MRHTIKHHITNTRRGSAVYVDLIYSQAAPNIARHPYMLGLIKELVDRTSVTGPKLRVERDMGRPIGHTYVIRTDQNDPIVYAQRLRDGIYTRFVKNGIPHPTKYLTIILERSSDGSYELVDAWLGRMRPPQPGSTDESEESRQYWSNHAFVLNGDAIRLRTLTKDCPY